MMAENYNNRVGWLYKKPIVTADPNKVRPYEILLQEKDSKITLFEKKSDGTLENITQNFSVNIDTIGIIQGSGNFELRTFLLKEGTYDLPSKESYDGLTNIKAEVRESYSNAYEIELLSDRSVASPTYICCIDSSNNICASICVPSSNSSETDCYDAKDTTNQTMIYNLLKDKYSAGTAIHYEILKVDNIDIGIIVPTNEGNKDLRIRYAIEQD